MEQHNRIPALSWGVLFVKYGNLLILLVNQCNQVKGPLPHPPHMPPPLPPTPTSPSRGRADREYEGANHLLCLLQVLCDVGILMQAKRLGQREDGQRVDVVVIQVEVTGVRDVVRACQPSGREGG